MNKIQMVDKFCQRLSELKINYERFGDYHVQIQREHNFYPTKNKYYNSNEDDSLIYNDIILETNESFLKFIREHTKFEEFFDENNFKFILDEVLKENINQQNKWGIQNHNPHKWNTILVEEVGEASESILEDDIENYRKELIQIAAVAVATIDCLDRHKK